MRLPVVFTFVAFAVVLAKERGDSCVTPTNEVGKCIPVKECSPIVDSLLKSGNNSAIEFARQSQCGYDSQPLVCCVTSTPLSSTGPSSDDSDALPNDSCGIHNLNAIVRGGNITQLEEHPWLAALEYKDKTNKTSVGIKCDGAVITKKYVLTAAHCIVANRYDLFRVWLGEHTLSTDPDCEDSIDDSLCADPVKKVYIEKQIPHPHYNPTTGENDIALLRLDGNIEFTEFIRPICVPNSNIPELKLSTSTYLTVSGWSLLQEESRLDGKFISAVVHLPHEACSAYKPLYGSCLTSKYHTRGTCWQASGGPLMRQYSGGDHIPRLFQEGVISGTISCDKLIYTPVSPYKTWIVDTIRGI